MNEEIKEVLEALDKIAKGVHYPEDLLYYENCQTLLDYITNLQEENEDYKSRCEKAIEELDKYINSCEIEAEHTLNNEKCLISINHSKKVKNILNGGDEE